MHPPKVLPPHYFIVALILILMIGMVTNSGPISETLAVKLPLWTLGLVPLICGLALSLIGATIILNSWLAWIVVFTFIVIIRLRFIAGEERLMAETFGTAFQEYRANVRRWI